MRDTQEKMHRAVFKFLKENYNQTVNDTYQQAVDEAVKRESIGENDNEVKFRFDLSIFYQLVAGRMP